MWNDESWTGEAETDEADSELAFEFGRSTRAAAARAPRPMSRPRAAAGFRRPPGRPWPRPRPRGRRAGGLLWDEPLLTAASCPGPPNGNPWNGNPDDPQSLRSLQGAFNQIIDELIRRAETGRS